jgi:feruloyl esterase
MEILASQIGLPTHGAKLKSAVEEAASSAKSSGLTRTVCVVIGAISPVDPTAPDIRFQINLPSKWNGKALHEGGGGYNGVLIDGRRFLYLPGVHNDWSSGTKLKPETLAASDPVAKGYSTFGSDSGHQWDPAGENASATIGAFALNAEALENFAGAQLKKVHDVALQVIHRFYGRAPRRLYFYGSSQGGHEGLIVAQRWPRDYDGVVAIHPAYDFTAVMLSALAVHQRVYGEPNAWLSPEKTALISDSVLQACDRLDGLKDGVVANVQGCRNAFDIRRLACASEIRSDCLSPEEMATAALIARKTSFGFSVSGVAEFAPWPLLDGALPTVMGGAALFGTEPVPRRPPSFTDSGMFLLADQFVRYVIMRDPAFDSLTFMPSQHVSAIQQASQHIDANSADLDTFRQHGGKLLLLHGSVDMAIPPGNSIAYHERLKSRYGAGLEAFVRFYMAPGFGHACGPFLVSWDSLTALQRWVEDGQAPSAQVATDSTPQHQGRARPLCEYPQWPKYRGSGDPNVAASFVCIADTGVP